MAQGRPGGANRLAPTRPRVRRNPPGKATIFRPHARRNWAVTSAGRWESGAGNYGGFPHFADHDRRQHRTDAARCTEAIVTNTAAERIGRSAVSVTPPTIGFAVSSEEYGKMAEF